MGLLHGTRRALLGGKTPYFKKVLSTGPIAYWPQWELTGTNAKDLINSPAQDGTYTGVTLNALAGPDGSPSPFFDGANDFNDIFSAPLKTAFDWDTGAVAAWMRVDNVGVWTDGTVRQLMQWGRRFGGLITFVRIQKANANNTLGWHYTAGGVNKSVLDGAVSTVAWFHVAMTWDRGADEMKAFLNGAQNGITQTGLGVPSGNLDVPSIIGAANSVPEAPWHGYLAHPAVWDRPLAPAEIANLAVA